MSSLYAAEKMKTSQFEKNPVEGAVRETVRNTPLFGQFYRYFQCKDVFLNLSPTSLGARRAKPANSSAPWRNIQRTRKETKNTKKRRVYTSPKR